MTRLTRRAFAIGATTAIAASGLTALARSEPADRRTLFRPTESAPAVAPQAPFGGRSGGLSAYRQSYPRLNPAMIEYYTEIYGPVPGEPFPIPAVDLSQVHPAYLRTEVDFFTAETPGTIVVDPSARYLYHVGPGGRAMRYGVGVGREGFSWSGVASINSKQEWPDWYPPLEMIQRQPEIAALLTDLQSGRGVPGGLTNPLGCRALYLWQNNRDTLYRIHGTLEPWTIGTNVSSGCIRLINQDAIHLYNRTPVGTAVVVLG